MERKQPAMFFNRNIERSYTPTAWQFLPPSTLPSTACSSLHLAVTTRGGTFIRKNRAMPGTQIEGLNQTIESLFYFCPFTLWLHIIDSTSDGLAAFPEI